MKTGVLLGDGGGGGGGGKVDEWREGLDVAACCVLRLVCCNLYAATRVLQLVCCNSCAATWVL